MSDELVIDTTDPNQVDIQGDPVDEQAWDRLTPEERDARYRAWLAARKERAEDQVARSRRSWAALQGWDRVTSQEQWHAIQDQAAEDWLSGKALLDMLGGERYLDPPRMGLILHLWHHFVQAYNPEGPAEYLCVAMALVAYHQFMRTTEAVGNLAARLEADFFSLSDPIQVRVVGKEGGIASSYGSTTMKIQGEQAVEELGRDLLPLLDRLNRLVIRNLKALRDLKTVPISMTVQNFGQLNVGQQQANLAATPPPQAPQSAAVVEKTPPRRRVRNRQR